jgi:hypothetical protein
MLFTSAIPTHAEKNGARRVLFPLKRANIAAFCLCDRAAGPSARHPSPVSARVVNCQFSVLLFRCWWWCSVSSVFRFVIPLLLACTSWLVGPVRCVGSRSGLCDVCVVAAGHLQRSYVGHAGVCLVNWLLASRSY